jgi:hypothetical protein
VDRERIVEPESIVEATLRQLEPVPTPEGVSSREIVRRAIEFEDPPRIPYYFLFHPSASDMVAIAPLAAAVNRSGAARALTIGQTYVDAWGVTWETTGRWCPGRRRPGSTWSESTRSACTRPCAP